MPDSLPPDLRRRTLLLGALLATAALPVVARAAVVASARRRIGIIGSGRIGSTLGGMWLDAGHEVMFSSRNLDHDRKLAASLGAAARAGTPAEALAFGEAVLIAVPYGALPQLGKDLGGALQGKVLIDASNPFVARDGEVARWAREKGAGLASAELLPGARIVRAFNAIGYARLPEASRRTGERTAMPIAGDDAEALALASALIRDIGFEPVVIGSLAMGRHLVPGTPLAGEHTAADIRRIAGTLR